MLKTRSKQIFAVQRCFFFSRTCKLQVEKNTTVPQQQDANKQQQGNDANPTFSSTIPQPQPDATAKPNIPIFSYGKSGKYLALGILKRRDDADEPQKPIDPEVAALAQKLAWKALTIATVINISVALAAVLVLIVYCDIHSLHEFRLWMEKWVRELKQENEGAVQSLKQTMQLVHEQVLGQEEVEAEQDREKKQQNVKEAFHKLAGK